MDEFDLNPNNRFIANEKELKLVNFNERDNNLIGRNYIYGNQKCLPIGNVVCLDDSGNLYMIIGFKYERSDSNICYVACEYPIGINANFSPISFTHDKIFKIFHIGYINVQEKKFKSEILDLDSGVSKKN